MIRCPAWVKEAIQLGKGRCTNLTQDHVGHEFGQLFSHSEGVAYAYRRDSLGDRLVEFAEHLHVGARQYRGVDALAAAFGSIGKNALLIHSLGVGNKAFCCFPRSLKHACESLVR